MGLWGVIKSMFGMGDKEPEYPVYIPPPLVYTQANQPFLVVGEPQVHDHHWEQMKERWGKRMAWERKRRSRYGGF